MMTKMSNPETKSCHKSISDDDELNDGPPYLASVVTLGMSTPEEDVQSLPFADIESQADEEHEESKDDVYMELNSYHKWPETNNYKKNNQQPSELYPASTQVNCPNYYTTNQSLNVQNTNFSLTNVQNVTNEMPMGLLTSSASSSYTYHNPEQRLEPPQMQNYPSVRSPYHTYQPVMTSSQYSLQGLNQHVQHTQQQPTAHSRRISPYMQSYHQQQQHHYQQEPILHPATMGLSNFHDKFCYPNINYGHGNVGAIKNNRNIYGAYNPPAYLQNNQNHQNMPYTQRYAQEPVLDLLQLSNCGRESRNRAEKNRRDKLNSYIQDLSGMVPHVAESARRVDKTAILRFAVHGLRLNHVFSRCNNSLTMPPQRDTTDALMHVMDSFFLTLTCRGEILLISSSVEKHLGHCQTDLYGQNILHITHPEDHNVIKQKLIPTDIEKLFETEHDNNTDGSSVKTKEEEEDEIDKRLHADKRSFTVRLARAGPRSDPTVYEVVKIDGNFRRSDQAPRGLKRSKLPVSLHMIRRNRERDDVLSLHNFSANDIVLTAIARVVHPPKIIDHMLEANKLEYKTRHLIDGRIVDCDQRISIVIGYMKNEVCNLSPFSFMHQDDARWVIVALRQMYDHHSSYGESAYRIMTRSGNFVFLHTKGFLEIDKRTNKVHSFVCVNTLLSNEEGRRRVQEMKNKFSIIIKANIPQSSKDVPASDNPQQLEKAVMCLIQNLQKSASEDDDLLDDRSSTIREGSEPNHKNYGRALTTPPLALVPPEADSVKDSISKSVSRVMNVAAAKLLREQPTALKSSQITLTVESADEASRFDSDVSSGSLGCTCHASPGLCEYCQNVKDSKIVGLGVKRPISTTADSKLQKRRFKNEEIEQVLSSSLDHIERSLNRQLNAAIELQDHGQKYELPNTQQRLHEILEEHQKQNALYVDIKSEYEVQLQNKSIDLNTTTVIKTEATKKSPETFTH